MEKRGQLVFEALLVIIASGVVISAFVMAGKSYGSQDAYYRLAVSKDLALAIDLMYALPGDVVFTYPNDVSSYDIEIKDYSIRVYSHKSSLDPVVGTYSFAGTSTDKIEVAIRGEKFVRLEKIGNNIKISGVDK